MFYWYCFHITLYCVWLWGMITVETYPVLDAIVLIYLLMVLYDLTERMKEEHNKEEEE